MTEILPVINIIANSAIFISMALFFILIYGNESNAVHRWPALHHWTLKISLVTVIAASLWNATNSTYTAIRPRQGEVLKFIEVPTGEVIMNIGLALLFTWAAWFHLRYFKRKREKT